LRELQKRWVFGLLAVALCIMLVPMLRSQYTSPKVENFLKSLPSFANIDLTRAAVQNLRFTEAENRELEAALRKPAYKAQIDRLLKTAKVPPGPAMPPPMSVETLKQEQPRRIASSNQKLEGQAKQIMAISAKVSVNIEAIMGTPPVITSLDPPETIEPSQLLMITGSNFLPQGTVEFTFGSRVFQGSVQYWANDFILVRFLQGQFFLPETAGKVTVRKSGPRRLSVDHAIRFVPIWDFKYLTSDQMTYDDNPWDPVLAFYLYTVRGQRDWCSRYNIPWPSWVPRVFLNTWRIWSYSISSEEPLGFRWGTDDPKNYINSTTLPTLTVGTLCHKIFSPQKLRCSITLMGPLGLGLDY
jgi:hypothetical protein